MRPVTQSDIAKALGLSQTTVALVVGQNNNHKGRAKLSKETVERIQAKARELGYRPNRFAQVMRNGQSTQVGVIFSSTQLQVASERAFYITQALTESGFEPVFYDESCHRKGLQCAFQTMLDTKVAGLILASTGSALEKDIHINNLPIPIVGISATDVGHHRLLRCDMRDGMLQVFRHLVEQGCRRIVLVSPFYDPTTYGTWKWQQQLQAQGVEDGAKEQGGEFSVLNLGDYAAWMQRASTKKGIVSALALCTTSAVDHLNTRWQPHFGGVAVARELLDSGASLPDAIICPNDDWAFGLICELMRAGVKIPQEIAITGFNDSSICDVFPIPFTSVRQPTEEICKLAIRMLAEEIAESGTKKPPASQPEIYDIKGELIVRDSSRFGTPQDELEGPLVRPSVHSSLEMTL